MLHLIAGNAIIGMGEGWLLAKWGGLPRSKTTMVMVAANYFSAWLGGGALLYLLHSLVPIELGNFQAMHVVAMVLAWLATVVLEWPFVWWACRGLRWSAAKCLAASLVLQSVSYAVILPWYWLSSATTVFNVAVVPAPELKPPAGIEVYYFATPGGDLRARFIDGGDERRIAGTVSDNVGDRLIARGSSTANVWDIVVVRDGVSKETKDLAVAVRGVRLAAVGMESDRQVPRDSPPGNWFNFGPALQLGVKPDSPWVFRSAFWAGGGLLAENKRTETLRRIALESPLANWNARNLVHLPNDQVLFQFGRDQICIYEPSTDRLALLWKGYGPLAVMPSAARLSP